MTHHRRFRRNRRTGGMTSATPNGAAIVRPASSGARWLAVVRWWKTTTVVRVTVASQRQRHTIRKRTTGSDLDGRMKVSTALAADVRPRPRRRERLERLDLDMARPSHRGLVRDGKTRSREG